MAQQIEESEERSLDGASEILEGDISGILATPRWHFKEPGTHGWVMCDGEESAQELWERRTKIFYHTQRCALETEKNIGDR
jgi:hypothetical protein